jgi:hypothetical protein
MGEVEEPTSEINENGGLADSAANEELGADPSWKLPFTSGVEKAAGIEEEEDKRQPSGTLNLKLGLFATQLDKFPSSLVRSEDDSESRAMLLPNIGVGPELQDKHRSCNRKQSTHQHGGVDVVGDHEKSSRARPRHWT